ncbi:MAG: LysE family transporter, partial [Desulfofustis sp.]|nr:LysE family transporter [Desulfofustis sp.]
MLLSNWLAFVFAASIILIIPGPTIILVISLALSHGRRSVAPLVAGVVCGDLTAMTFSLAGLGALLAASAHLFLVFKWLGALYLIYLGVRLWRSN